MNEVDSEDEVFINNNIFTSTPSEKPARKRKRSPVKTSPRRTRQRSRMSKSSEYSGGDMEEDTVGMSEMAKIALEMKKINDNIHKMQKNIEITVATAVAPISIRLDENSKRIDKIEKKQANERK